MGQTSTTSEPTRRRTPPAPSCQPLPAHDEGTYRDSLTALARQEAERAALDLDVVDLAPEHHARVGRQLGKRRNRMLRRWRRAAAAAGLPRDTIAAERENHLALAFRDRVRELRAASGPRGHA